MKRIVTLLYLIMPSILLSFINYIPVNAGPANSGRLFEIYLIFLYLITLIGIVLFFVFKLHLSSFYALLLGLLLSPMYTAISEYRSRLGLPPYLRDFGIPYAGTMFSIMFYAVPFILVSIIVFAFLKGKRSKCTK